MDEATQTQLRFIVNEKSIADLQKQVGILESNNAIMGSSIATLQGQIGSLNSRLDGYKRNSDDRLKVLENHPSLNSVSYAAIPYKKEKVSFWSKFWK